MSISNRRRSPVGTQSQPVRERGGGLLFVCTGNVCRSAFAALAMNQFLERAGVTSLTVSSAGTHALVGDSIDETTARLCEDLEIDPTGHVARQLVHDDARDAGLILTATRAHRRHVVQLEPRAVRYTFTLRQAGRLLVSLRETGHDLDLGARAGAPDTGAQRPVLDLQPLRDALARQRGSTRAADPGDDDVLDPRGRPIEVHRTAVEQMVPSLNELLAILAVPARSTT